MKTVSFILISAAITMTTIIGALTGCVACWILVGLSAILLALVMMVEQRETGKGNPFK